VFLDPYLIVSPRCCCFVSLEAEEIILSLSRMLILKDSGYFLRAAEVVALDETSRVHCNEMIKRFRDGEWRLRLFC